MARRIELQGITNDLNGSFISRNNDFRGYWAIGQLKLFSINNNLTSMEFSLIKPKIAPLFNLQNYTIRHYATLLRHLLRRQQIPDFWVSEASITIDFHVNAKHAQLHEYSTTGEPFQCYCQIIDDNGRNYSSIIYGRCQPHSAVKELKSTRKLTV